MCAVKKVKIVWTILLRRIRPHLDPDWVAIQSWFTHDAIVLEDTIANVDPMALIIASLDVNGAFSKNPWLLSEAVLERSGLAFYNFTSDYTRSSKDTVCTGAVLILILEPGSRVPEGGAQGPLLYLLVTLPLALRIEQEYPAYAPHPLLSPLMGFKVAHIPHKPQMPDDRPTVTLRDNDLLDVTISYLPHNNLIAHPTKFVAMIK